MYVLIEERCLLQQNMVRDWMVLPSIIWDESVIGLLNLKQEMMTMVEVVKIFEKLKQLCTFVKLCKEERVQQMMKYHDLTL